MPHRVDPDYTNSQKKFEPQPIPPIVTLDSSQSPAESSDASFETSMAASTSVSSHPSPLMYASATPSPSIRPQQYNYNGFRSDHERDESFNHHSSTVSGNGTYTPPSAPDERFPDTNLTSSNWNNGSEYYEGNNRPYNAPANGNNYSPYAGSKYVGTVGAVSYGSSASAAYNASQNSSPYITSASTRNSSAQNSSQYTIVHTDDAATKLSDRVRRRCFNCCTSDTSTWRRSNLNPGKVLCNKCGLFERTHSRSRPDQFPHRRGPLAAAMVKRSSPSFNGNQEAQSGQSPRMRQQIQSDASRPRQTQDYPHTNGGPQAPYLTPSNHNSSPNTLSPPSNTGQSRLPPIISSNNRQRPNSRNSEGSRAALPEIQSWLREDANGSHSSNARSAPPSFESSKSPLSVPALPRVVGMDRER